MSKKYAYYFCKTPPKNYTFLGFYKYRRQQSDFTFSYQKESRKLRCDLEELTREDSEAVRVSANKLIQDYKNHREKYPDVKMFWNNIESSVADSSLRLDKVNTARTVIHGTEMLIKTALNEVDSTLKTDGGFVSNNVPNERPAEEALSEGVSPIGNTDDIIKSRTSSKRGLNCEKNDDVVAKRGKTGDKSQDQDTSEKSTEDEPRNTPPQYIYISSDSEDEEHKLDEDDDRFFDDINDMKMVSFNDYLNQNKESEWKLKDGRLIVDIVNIKTAELIKLASEKEKERTQITKSVIRLGLSSIIDLSSEFDGGMYTWFEEEWIDIKRMVYGVVNMEPNAFEGEISNIINTIEEMCDSYKYNEVREYLFKIKTNEHSKITQQVSAVYFYVIDELLKNPFKFVDKSGRYQELTEIEYVMFMTAPIINNVFSDTLDYLKFRWGETSTNIMSDRRRKIDLRIVHQSKKIELSHSECAKAPTPGKAVQDRSKCLRTLKGVLDNLLKEDLTDEEVQDSKVLGLQFAGIDLLDDGLYFGLEGPTFSFPAQLINIKCLRGTLEALYFFKQEIIKKMNLIPDPRRVNHPYNQIFHSNSDTLIKATHFKTEFIRETHFTPKKKRDGNSHTQGSNVN
ncbi:2985_t:CDS:10 [Funneliformis geosporum]|nr:2985_t:CDS:10 [Funneliformis geosporum]